MAVIVNGDGILTGVSSLTTALDDLNTGRGTVTGVATVGTLQLGAGVSISSPRSQQAAIFTNNTEFFTVDDAGRVGVGTITPNSDAHPENEKKINVGFITARSIAGDIDANTMVVAGVSTFVGAINGTLTGTASGNAVLTGSTNNTIVTVTGANAITGEANLTFDGITLEAESGSGVQVIRSKSAGSSGDYAIVEVRNSSTTRGRLVGDAAVDAFRIDTAGGASTPITFLTGSSYSERLRIDSAGKIGVNLTPSTGQFVVKNSDDANINVLEVYNDNGNMSGSFSQSSAGDGTVGVRKNDGTLSVFFRSNGISYLTGGEFGINTTTPVEKLGISGNMRFVNPNDNTSRITALPSGSYNVGNSGGSAVCFHRFSDAGGGSDEIFFETHHQGSFHGETLRIEKTGDIKVKRGDLYFETAGKGIVLGATSNTDANTLSDYEEGTFTAGIQDFNGTYTANTGTYTKIGNVVTIQVMIQGNGGSGSGSLRITSLPFSSENSPSSYRAAGSVHAHKGVVTGGVQVTALMNNNDNKIMMRTFQNNATTTDLNRNGLNSSGGWELVVGMVYHTAS